MDGAGDGVPGIYLDRLGPAAILSIYEDARLSDPATTDVADVCLDRLRDVGVNAVYVKLFARDRSRLGGMAPEEARSATPRAGTPQPETLCVHEYASRFEIRPYDGFSTGLFLEHREHRRSLAEMRPQRALNLFAYTCAFAVPLVAAGAVVVNVDVSARYLEWGRRNLALNGAPVDAARFVRMDAREYLTVAARRGEPFDLIIIDPPTFAAADPRRKRPAWKAVSDYPELIRAAARVLMPGGVMGGVFGSGSIADYIQSLERIKGLNSKILLSGHGRLSDTPQDDVRTAIQRSHGLLEDTAQLFDALDARQNFDPIMQSVRDLNKLDD